MSRARSLLIFKGDASDTNYTKERKRERGKERKRGNDASSHVITRRCSFFCDVNARCDRASSSVTGWKSDKEGFYAACGRRNLRILNA